MSEQNDPEPDRGIGALTCVTGFIATEPTLTTEDGVSKLTARYGVERSRTEPDGTLTRLEPRFHTLVAYRAAARVAYARFRKFDAFIAQGRVSTNTRTGKPQFEAEQLGHNALRTRYAVDRRPRPKGAEPARAEPGLDAPRAGRHSSEPHGLSR